MIRTFVFLFVVVCVVKATVIVNVYGENKAEYSSLDSCNSEDCDKLCRKYGFPGGLCIDDQCKCGNVKPKTLKDKVLSLLLTGKTVNKGPNSLDDCNLQACEQLCRNLGFPGGACVGDKCDCDNFKTEKGVSSKANDYKLCDYGSCYWSCVIMGKQGTCIGDECYCF